MQYLTSSYCRQIVQKINLEVSVDMRRIYTMIIRIKNFGSRKRKFLMDRNVKETLNGVRHKNVFYCLRQLNIYIKEKYFMR